MPDIFISYKKEDVERVAPLASVLESWGFTVWWDSELVAGEDWGRRIKSELDQSSCVIVAWSERSIGTDRNYLSPYILQEAREGARRKILIPVLFDADRTSWEHSHIQYVDLTAWDATEAHEQIVSLADAVETFVGNKSRPRLEEVQNWQRARSSQSVLALEKFIRDFPESRFSDAAHRLLVDFRERDDWAAASAAPTFLGIVSFIDNWPDGRFAALAKAELRDRLRTRSEASWHNVLLITRSLEDEESQCLDAALKAEDITPAMVERYSEEEAFFIEHELGLEWWSTAILMLNAEGSSDAGPDEDHSEQFRISGKKLVYLLGADNPFAQLPAHLNYGEYVLDLRAWDEDPRDAVWLTLLQIIKRGEHLTA